MCSTSTPSRRTRATVSRVRTSTLRPALSRRGSSASGRRSCSGKRGRRTARKTPAERLQHGPGLRARVRFFLNSRRTTVPVVPVARPPALVRLRRMTIRRISALTAVALFSGVVAAQQKIYWADEVPAGWHGQWSAEVQTVAERSGFTRTVSSIQLLEFISALKGKSENIHVVNMFVSPMRKVAPAIVLSNPRVTSAQQARTSGKPVMFLFGNIHPPEPEAAEALMMVARDLAMGARKNLLDNQTVIIAPIFNVDGTDTFETQDGSLGSETPYIQGTRENAAGLDLNRDAVKLQTVEAM